MILSFGWTAELLPPNGCKTETRRFWSERTLNAWRNAWGADPTRSHKAYDKQACFGGKQIGWLTLTDAPRVERVEQILEDPDAITREGHPELSAQQFLERYFWKPKKSWTDKRREDEWNELMVRDVVVVRFRFEPMASDPQPSREQLVIPGVVV